MKKRAGFTLVELLVALAITSLLVVVLANVVSTTLNAWQQGRNRLDTFSNARQLIGRLADEIGAAVATTTAMEFVENDPDLGPTIAEKSENVFFVAPYPNSGAGDLCVVMYRHNDVTHRLERRFKDSAGAWNVASTDRYKVGTYPDTSPTEWRTIADGVMEFEIRSYTQRNLDEDQPPVSAWDSRTAGETAGKTPRRIVLRLKVVDDRTLVRLAAMQPNSPGYTETMTRSAREFFADFTLPGR